MEDPKSRPAVAKLINEIIIQHKRDTDAGFYGWSLCMKIYHKLKKEGFLIEA